MTAVDYEFALVEAALCRHAAALGYGPRAPNHSGFATSIVEPILIVLTGYPADRAQAEPSALDHFLRPAVDSGWRSESVFRSEAGGKIKVELVTATPSPASDKITNPRTPLACSDILAAGRLAARTAALHRLGEVDRACSDRQAFQPDRMFVLGTCEPRVATAPSALASLWSLLNAAEASVTSHLRFPPVACSRRLHVFAEIETGMNCAISSEIYRDGAQAPAKHSIRSSIRRVPDGATLAVCETVLR